MAGSTSTVSWDLPTLAGFLWTEQPGKLRAGGGRFVSDSWQQLQHHIQWEVAGEGVPLARPCQVLHHGYSKCATSHSGTETGTQNREPAHPAQAGTARQTTPEHTWHWAHGASTHNLAHNICTQLGQVQPATQHLYTVWPGTAGASTAAPWHVKARQFPGTQPSLCHHPCQTVLAPASTAQQSGDSGDLHMSRC